ncbi:L-threonylcarbamoyladenylate synthase [Brachybacterium huguangmaarense]
MSVYDTKSEDGRDEALDAAVAAVRDGKLIVLPTDTVYGIGADAFRPEAVQDLLDAKGRGRSVPPPVLVGDPAVLLALAVDVPEYAERLTEEFWPGALTLILTAQPTLGWDLGETRGTVALRMPDDPSALELLRRTGPLAVSSANRHGRPAALTVLDAATQLGDSVEVYLDGGTARIGTSSTIIDTTVEPPEIVREGALTREQIIDAVGDIFTVPDPEPVADPDAVDAIDAAPEADAAPVAAEGAAAAGDHDALEPESAVIPDGHADGIGAGDAAGGSVDAAADAPVIDLPSEAEVEADIATGTDIAADAEPGGRAG